MKDLEKGMKLFISGPMTGYAYFNHNAFVSAEMKLKEMGFDVINPVDMDKQILGESYMFEPVDNSTFSKEDLGRLQKLEEAAIEYCDGIYLLKGWTDSVGSKRELAYALKLNKKVICEGEI